MAEMWHIHTIIFHTVIRMNKLTQHATTCKNLRNKILSKRVKEYLACDLVYITLKSRKKLIYDDRLLLGVVTGRSLKGLLQGW